MEKVIIIAIAATLAACAKHPDQISAAALPTGTYATLSCSAVTSEREQIARNLANLETAQMDAVTGDALGVLVLGLPVYSLSGKDNTTAISIERGKLAALANRQATCR